MTLLRTFFVSALLIAWYCVFPCTLHAQELNQSLSQDVDEESQEESEEPAQQARRIVAITVTGNKLVPSDAILDRLPYKIGEFFDAAKTRQLIHNLYFDLKRLRTISVYGQPIGNDGIKLFIKVQEKNPLKEVIFKGNKQVTQKELREKTAIGSLPALDKEELKKYILAIGKIYRDKGYHNTTITADLELDKDGKATAIFTITEHQKALVKQIKFTGNNHISGKKLRNVLFTREDWVLGFTDKAGTYQQERIDADKHMIEQFYQNNGYINAKVTDANVAMNPTNQHVIITFTIEEGDQYMVNSVSIQGSDILSEAYLQGMVPIKPGQIYSRERIVESIKALEFMWGDMGYAYAHIEPSVQPDDDKKTVAVAFYCELGKSVILRRLNIVGNKKTRDKVIRRKISLDEGNIITQRHMEGSKNRIESLGYFDQRDGVNWKMTRISEDLADLDLVVKEIKTGNAHLQLSFGGNAQSLQSASTGVALEAVIRDTNLFGSGIRFNLTGRLGNDEKTILFNLTQPWLFDRPIFGAVDLYHKRVSYDELSLTRPVNEKYTGASGTIGFVTSSRHHIFSDTFLRFNAGLDDIRYEGRQEKRASVEAPTSEIRSLVTPAETMQANEAYNILLSRLFTSGNFGSLSMHMGKDAKNHPMHPTRGFSWLWRSIVSLPALNGRIGFGKFDLDAHWFTPLIGDFDLILHLHGYLGLVAPFKHTTVPYRELFHIGGQSSVRGFFFGQIGPQFRVFQFGTPVSDSIGGGKTFFVNAELIFPIMQDFSLKGLFFYDGGAGWDNPYACDIPQRFIFNNNFNYRHSVGFGIRLLNPMPIKVDWGFKLDPRKGEHTSEVHFAMSYDF